VGLPELVCLIEADLLAFFVESHYLCIEYILSLVYVRCFIMAPDLSLALLRGRSAESSRGLKHTNELCVRGRQLIRLHLVDGSHASMGLFFYVCFIMALIHRTFHCFDGKSLHIELVIEACL
jgi:hypothetical protein